jgi:hypothetical protein
VLGVVAPAIPFEAVEAVVLYPVDDETVGRQQSQLVGRFDGLERPDPGIEVVLRKLAFQSVQALFPKGRSCRRVLCHGVLIADE